MTMEERKKKFVFRILGCSLFRPLGKIEFQNDFQKFSSLKLEIGRVHSGSYLENFNRIYFSYGPFLSSLSFPDSFNSSNNKRLTVALNLWIVRKTKTWTHQSSHRKCVPYLLYASISFLPLKTTKHW